jgi:anaerobic magnesium-protoporphyrin IX monomethyl ester cyclase
MMRHAGCDSVSFGVESGNPEMLQRIKKGITLEKVRKAVDLCKEVGLLAHTSFIVGLPGESPETLQDTKRFARSLGSLYGYHFLAPFPGTTVRERIEEYDLEILTDDWRRYDANSAIVRTSKLSAEDINRFVAEYDLEIDRAWQKMIRGYYQKTNYPHDDMKVEGHFRTQLIYQILAEDLVETLGVFPVDALGYETANMLSLRIEEHTAADPALVRRVIADFVERGYIKSALSQGHLVWYWTRNNVQDR